MKKFILIFVLGFMALGAYLLYKQFVILGNTPNFQTGLNNNKDLADPNFKFFNIQAQNCNFIPDNIKVNTGDRVRIYVKSMDVMYGFSIPDYGIDTTINPEQTGQVDFTADKTGDFQFFSSVFCTAPVEKPKEVTGTLTVE
jgi:cytochrome c oxidase subunit II